MPISIKKLNYGPICTTASFTFPLGTENKKREEVTRPPPQPPHPTHQKGQIKILYKPQKQRGGRGRDFLPALLHQS